MSIGAIFGRARSWVSGQFDSLTRGQRWTSTLAIGLAVVMLLAGMPSNIRVIAAPPATRLPPIVIAQPPAPLVPFIPPAPVVLPSTFTPPEPEPPKPEPGFTPPPPPPKTCATDALPNVPALITVSVLLNQVYDALEAAGVPPIDLPEPPVVDIPDVPAPVRPVLSALAPVVLPACTGVPFFGVTVGIGGAFGLLPIADGLLPIPTSEILPYMWPVRALCRLLTQYAPPPGAAAAAIAKPGLGR